MTPPTRCVRPTSAAPRMRRLGKLNPTAERRCA
jgi:hypothetical protein